MVKNWVMDTSPVESPGQAGATGRGRICPGPPSGSPALPSANARLGAKCRPPAISSAGGEPVPAQVDENANPVSPLGPPRMGPDDHLFVGCHSGTETDGCICLRPPRVIMCRVCGHMIEGRVRTQCGQHPTHLYLYDVDRCPNKKCNAVALMLKESDLNVGKIILPRY